MTRAVVGGEWVAQLVAPVVPAPTRAFAVPGRLRVAAGRLACLVVVATGGYYLYWRALQLPALGALGVAFYVAEVVSFLGLLILAVLLVRARWRRRPAPAPRGTLDVFVTVCGEPVEMVLRTLRAALAIEYPHYTYVLNDGRIAGKPGWEEIDRLALAMGVPCFTRRTGARGKAANLNHALARTSGDFVATIDADHLCERDLALQTLGYFQRDDVAFVATRQRFSVDRGDPLNNNEPFFYDAIQPAKDADGCAISCGNGSVYRREALDRIGGFSEWNLVEDLHTSYLLHADGWRSVYHPQPVTTGTSPATAAEYAKQRLRWACDSLRILFFDNPLFRRGLRLRHRLHYLHTTSSYIVSVLQLVFVAGPLLWIFGRQSLLDVAGDGDLVLHAGPYWVATFLFLAIYARPRGALSALQTMLFNAPVNLLATAHTLLRLRPNPDPTAKARQPRFSLLLVPQVVCFLLLAGATAFVLVDQRPYASALAAFWAGLQAFQLAGPLSAVSRRPRPARLLRGALRLAVIVLLLPAMALPLLLPRAVGATGPFQLLGSDEDEAEVAELPDPPAPLPPAGSLAVPEDGAYIGVSNSALAYAPGRVGAWGALWGADPAIVNWFQHWRSGETAFRRDLLETVARQGAVPMITWEPWARPPGSYSDPEQEEARLVHIIDGEHDEFIRSWAEGAAEYGRPLMIRFMQEMNGYWYPWSVGHNGNTAEDFVAAWRHVHDIFTEAGADNVSWVWTVNMTTNLPGSPSDLATIYPGDEYVDWVSTTGFNWGEAAVWSTWKDADELFAETYERLLPFGKPIMISEVGTSILGGDPDLWVEDTLQRFERDYPEIRAVLWYDERYDDTVDFRLWVSGGSGLRRALAGSDHWISRPVTQRRDAPSGRPLPPE